VPQDSTYRKKLIEVSLPLDAINAASAREKSIRHGHPSTLHLWWARRPLAACRAVLFSSLVNDPGDDPMYSLDESVAATERGSLHSLIEDLVQWENSNNPEVINRARLEIARSIAANKVADGELSDDAQLVSTAPELPEEQSKYLPDPPPEYTPHDVRFKMPGLSPTQVNHFLAHYAPPVLDPFAGGGSIPLEAQRLGLRAYASDLNPVPVLINKALIEIPPRFAGQPPVNPESRGVSSEELEGSELQDTDGLAEGDGSSKGSLSAGSKASSGGDVRNAVAGNSGDDVGSGEHRRGMDTGVEQGESKLSINRPGKPGGDGNVSDSVRGDRLVPEGGDEETTKSSRGSRKDAQHSAKKVSRKKQTLNSKRLIPKSYRGAEGLAEDVRYYGKWMRDEAEKRIGHLYPKVKVTQQMVDDGRPDLEPYVGHELTVLAWIWARTVKSPNPAVGEKQVPLIRSFWLSKKKGKEAYVYPEIDQASGSYRFRVRKGKPPVELLAEDGTVKRSGGTCILSQAPMPFTYIREQGKSGEIGTRLMAIICEGKRTRLYIEPNEVHETAADVEIPDSMPSGAISHWPGRTNVVEYGMDGFEHLFSNRQAVALVTFSDLVSEAHERIKKDCGNEGYANAVATYLAFTVSRQANRSSTICPWNTQGEKIEQTFGRQAIPMTWDFAESNPFSDSTGNWMGQLKFPAMSIESSITDGIGVAEQKDATDAATYGGEVVCTDPPYYDNIGYAELSDFFYLWLRKCLSNDYPQLLGTMLTPKSNELIACPYRHGGDRKKASEFFEKGLGESINQWRRNSNANFPTTIFYAFKQSETDSSGTASTGWETFLAGIIENGFAITATWPMRTEKTRGLKIDLNALASPVDL